MPNANAKLPFKVLQGFEYEGKAIAAGSFIGLTDEEAEAIDESLIEKVEPVMQKHTITERDLEVNPALKDEGVQVGDEIELPVYDRNVLKEIGVPVEFIEGESDEPEAEDDADSDGKE